ncbi:MAG: hypothetical protein ACYC3W_10620 [Candidatus Nanopelagicales bacterium]
MKIEIANLKPDYANESKESYVSRIASLAPNIPKDILIQWLYDHYDCVKQRYSWLDISTMEYNIEVWSKEEIYNNIKPWNGDAVESWKKQFIENSYYDPNRLITYMKTNNTWPVPPIILDNDRYLTMPNGDEIGRFGLIEGHHRYAYFKGLYLSKPNDLLNEHKLWVLKVTR